MQGILVSEIYLLDLVENLFVNKPYVIVNRLIENNVEKFLALRIGPVYQSLKLLPFKF